MLWHAYWPIPAAVFSSVAQINISRNIQLQNIEFKTDLNYAVSKQKQGCMAIKQRPHGFVLHN
jgi:hypothetical protein